MLLGTLGASLLGNLLTGKGIYKAGKGKGMHRAGEGIVRAGEGNNNLPNKIKDGAYVINLDEYSDLCTHWIALYVKNNDITYFDSFGVEHIPKEIKAFIKNRNIETNIFRIQAYDSIICGYFYIGFIDFMLKGKSLTEYTNPVSPNDFKKNDDTILNYFMNNA